MAPSPDLFVVCKNCQAEVSPYITECPYCGHRLRKRAPKLEKGGTPKPVRERRPKRDRPPRLGRLRAGELPGVRGDSRPWVALAFVAVPVLFTLLATVAVLDTFSVVMLTGIQGDPWRPLTTAFYYGSTGYEIVAVGGCFLFGWLLERRHGWWAPLVVFLLGTAAGTGLALLGDPEAFLTGANAGALALLGAWVVRDALAVRANAETETDWLAVAGAAIILALLPVAYVEANALAGIGGAVAGLALGIPLARLRER